VVHAPQLKVIMLRVLAAGLVEIML
jgi:hypothetical protein